MPEVTIEAIEKVLDSKLEPINTKLDALQETVASHSTSLDNISRDVKDLKEQMIVANRRMDKHEVAIKLSADKIEIASEVNSILGS